MHEVKQGGKSQIREKQKKELRKIESGRKKELRSKKMMRRQKQ